MLRKILVLVALLLVGLAGYFLAFRPLTQCVRNIAPGGNLATCNLSGKDLSGRDLSGANLSWANLSKANLANANLSGANLYGANLTDAILDSAVLLNANLSRANLANRDFSGTDFSGASFIRANLSGANLTNAKLSNAMLLQADLSMVHFIGADVTNANLAGANLTQANLTDANLKSAVLAYANLDDAILINADLSEANLLFANLPKANLSEANLTGADLINTDLEGANLSRANLTNVDLTNANLTGATLDRANLDRTTLIGAKGLTDEILADALEISTDELYLATAQRQIRLESRQDIHSQLNSLCQPGNRQGFTEATAIQPLSPTTIFFLFDFTFLEFGFASPENIYLTLPESMGLEPMAARFAEVVVCVSQMQFKPIETCSYIGGPDITRYQWQGRISVVETRTGHILAERTLDGPLPKQCPRFAPVEQTKILGDPIRLGDLLQELSLVSFDVNGKTISLQNPMRGKLEETVQTWNILPDGSLMHPLQEDRKFTDAELLSVAFSPDATLLVTTSRNPEDPTNVRLWRVSDGTRLRSLYSRAHEVAFSPDGVLLAAPDISFLPSGLYEHPVQLWQVSNGAILRTLKGAQEMVESVAFSPDGTLLAVGTWDGNVYLWRVSDGAHLRTFKVHTNSVTNVVFSPDGTLLAAGSDDGTVELLRVGALFSRFRELEGDRGDAPHRRRTGVTSISFSPDSNLFASSLNDKVWLWRVSDGVLLRTLRGNRGSVHSMTFSPDGQILAMLSGDSTIQLWRVSDGTLLHTLPARTELAEDVAFSPDGRYLLTAGQDGIFIWPIGEK